ncbi:hypothetical protein L7F22_011926 [Adiantum nelumboides]|nr:hypothetical protein [Adiantum nelumboides]
MDYAPTVAAGCCMDQSCIMPSAQSAEPIRVRPMMDYVPWELHVGEASMPIVEEFVNEDEPFVKESLYGKGVVDAKRLVQLEEVEHVPAECFYKRVAKCDQVVSAESLRLDDKSGHDDGPAFVEQLENNGVDIKLTYGEDDEATRWSFEEDKGSRSSKEFEEPMLIKVKLPCNMHEDVVVATMNEEHGRVSKLGNKNMQVKVLCTTMLVMMLVKVAIEGASIVQQVQGFPKKRRVVGTKEAEQVEEDGKQEALDAHQREGQLRLPMDCTRDALDTGFLEQGLDNDGTSKVSMMESGTSGYLLDSRFEGDFRDTGYNFRKDCDIGFSLRELVWEGSSRDAKRLVQLEEVEPVPAECLYERVADCDQVVSAESLRLDDKSGHDDGPAFVEQLENNGVDIKSTYGEYDEATSWSSEEHRDSSWSMEFEEPMLIKVNLPCNMHGDVVVATMNEEQGRVSKLGNEDMQVKMLC